MEPQGCTAEIPGFPEAGSKAGDAWVPSPGTGAEWGSPGLSRARLRFSEPPQGCAWPRQFAGGGEWPVLARRDAQGPFPLRIAPALLRQASYGTIKIGIYQSLKRLFVDRMEDETLLINVICGVVSGVISSALANPTDVLKIRMQAQGSLFQGGMIGSFIDIYQQEGTRGLWRGVVPTAQRAAIVVGVELPVYDITKKHLILSGLMGDTIFAHFVSSFTCGLAGAIASNPVDVVRTRMMNQRAIVGSSELYKGTLDGLVKTWKSEGFFALYKGFWPNWLRLGPWNIIFFITYEQLKRLPF
ncbi:PREDICTED: brain mitochondrial carrier protein 1 [Corvus brachyrhynchos]|nr:PREDICTED: brain mitochondrial carrier protein 1 [Corvus brachyrhynchos]